MTAKTATEPTDWMSYYSAHETGDMIGDSAVSFYGTTEDGRRAARTQDGHEYVKLIEQDDEWHELNKCAYCGTKGTHRYHSGVPECGPCWDWRKLDSAATRYRYIIALMTGSSIDMYDLSQYFPRVLGLSEDDIKAYTRINALLFDKTEALAKEHHLDEHWRMQAQALYTQLETGIWPDPSKKEKSDDQH